MKHFTNKTMSMFFCVILCVSLVFMPAIASAGQPQFTKPATESDGINFKSGRLTTTGGFKIKFKEIVGTATQFTYIPNGSKEATPIDVSKVMRIEKQTGSEAGKWALYLGLSALLGASLGVMQSSENSSGVEVSSETKLTIVVALTAISTLIGLLIGASKKTYETAYKNPNF